MTDIQLYFVIGVPVFAVIMTGLGGMLQMNVVGGRLTSLESSMNARFTSIENRFTNLETRIENRFASLESRFDTLTAKWSKSITG